MSEPKPSPGSPPETNDVHLPAPSRFDSPQRARLRASLLDAQRRISALPDTTEARVLQRCRDCLQRAVAAAAHDSYVAWDCLHQLDDELLATLPQDERRARFLSMRAEAGEKLRGTWREQAVEQLAKLIPEGQAPPLHLLRELHSHLAAASQNKHHQLDQFQRRSLPWLAVLLSLALLGVAAYSAWILFRAPDIDPRREWALRLLLGVCAGALGGILSMAFSMGSLNLRAPIPDVHLSGLVALTRPLLGAAVAVPVLVLVNGQSIAFSVATLDGWKLVAFCCFLGGFSERWFLDLMKRVEGEKQ